MSDFLEHITNKITNATLVTDPWKYIVIDDFFPEPVLEKFLAMHESLDWEDLFDEESSWFTVKKPNNEMNILKGDTFTQSLFEIFDYFPGEYITKQSFKDDTNKNTLQPPHRDKGEFIMTLQVFLQPESYKDGGTIVMSDSETDIVELPLVTNSCTIFLTNDKSWHRVEQRNYERKSFLQRWIAA